MSSIEAPTRHDRRFWPMRIAAGIALLVLIASLSFLELGAQNSAHRDLEKRFASRADTASSFLQAYIDQIFDREKRLASLRLDQGIVTHEQFLSYVESLDFGPTVLLDETGHVLEIAPSAPDLIGTDFTGKYSHLAKAVQGKQNVSNMVKSAVQGIPVVAFATPFDSASGRRIISGAFDLSTTPIGEYLSHVSSYQNSEVYLLDAKDNVVASNTPADDAYTKVSAPLAKAAQVRDSKGHYNNEKGKETYYVSLSISGTPWRLIVTAPSSELYAPIQGTNALLPWLFLVGFMLLAAILLFKLVRGREIKIILQETSTVDLLTGIMNKRGAHQVLTRVLSAAKRRGTDLTLMLLDIDRFKDFNENHGHDVGDDVLRAAAEHIASCLRTEDLVARWDGATFMIILSETNAVGALVVAERIRERIARNVSPVAGEESKVTASIGVASAYESDTVDAFVERASIAMARAKDAGRDCVYVSSEVPADSSSTKRS